MNFRRNLIVSATLLLLAPTFGCVGGDDSDSDSDAETSPYVLSTVPVDHAVRVRMDSDVTATFSEPMSGQTITTDSFFLTSGAPATKIPGTVTYADGAAVFTPAADLPADATIVATVTQAAESDNGVAVARDVSWSFTTGDALGTLASVDLGAAGGYVILAKTGISTVPTSSITGDIAASPITASAITGFGLTADATNVFATSPQVVGKVYAADYAEPTPTNLTVAVSAMQLAFTDAAGRAPDVTELGAGNIGGMTLGPGVYKWGTGLLVPTDLTLSGSATDVWIFEIAADLNLSSGAAVVLAGGALPQHIFWQVAGSVELGTTSHLEGVVLSQTGITLRTGASVNGRLFAQTAVDLDGSTVVEPAP